ncbi:MAG: calcium/sodium antiporter [Calditrichae bacterium]|nr:calcium/sodium antiporter [Calditrichia bacterium]
MIFLNVIVFFVGLLFLYIGAELLVRGSSRIALMLRISPIIVGLTIVAFGTSSPEFLVSFIAAYSGSMDVAVGNIIGSNIANLGLVLGLSALLRPILNLKDDIKSELYWVTVVSFVFWIFAANNIIGRFEGFLLFAGIVVFTFLLARQSLRERNNSISEDVPDIATGWAFIDRLSRKKRIAVFALWSFAGIAILGYGSDLTIGSAVAIAEALGVSKVIIGLTMVAFGTSLPELATAIISVVKKENEILIGNVIGSNLFNILGVAGPIALFFPIPISDDLIQSDFPIMLLFTFALFIVMLWKKRIGRIFAFILFASYISYIISVIL